MKPQTHLLTRRRCFIQRDQLHCCVKSRTSIRTKRFFSSSTPNTAWRKIIEENAKHNNIKLEDLHELDAKYLDQETRSLLNREFKGSLYSALNTLFPEREWHPWKFQQERVPRGYWQQLSNQRKYFDDLAKKIGVHTLDDWYEKLSQDMLVENGCRLSKQYKESPAAALMAAYPEHKWIPWKFNMVSKGYFKNMTNQRKYFDWLGEELGIKQLDDWYQKLSTEAMLKTGGYTLLRLHKRAVNALVAVYPEHDWVIWKFNVVPQGFWKDQSNQRKFFDDLGLKIGVKSLDDWYEKLNLNVVLQHGGGGLLTNQYNSSATAALMAAYPEHTWIPWKFRTTPMRFWKEESHKKQFFEYVGKKLGVQTLDDWYDKLSADLFMQNGASGLLAQYKNSPAAVLMTVYPEHNWIPWKFNTASKGTWASQNNVKQFLAVVAEKLSIQTLDDWYRVDRTQLNTAGASSVLQKYRGLYNILKEQYPHHPWDPKRFKQSGRKAQRWLTVTLKKMFPGEEIIEDYLHPKAVFPSSNRWMQLDVYIPSKNLAFEYQGKQHYEDVSIFGPSKSYQQRDEEKRTLCAANNIKLIEVPYWWNRTQDSLQEMISEKTSATVS